MTRDFASPMLANSENSSSESISFLPASYPPLIPKQMMAPLAVGQVPFPGALIVAARFEAGIVDPLDTGMLLEVASHGESVPGMALHAQVEGFDPLAAAETALERRHGRAGIAETLNTRT